MYKMLRNMDTIAFQRLQIICKSESIPATKWKLVLMNISSYLERKVITCHIDNLRSLLKYHSKKRLYRDRWYIVVELYLWDIFSHEWLRFMDGSFLCTMRLWHFCLHIRNHFCLFQTLCHCNFKNISSKNWKRSIS